MRAAIVAAALLLAAACTNGGGKPAPSAGPTLPIGTDPCPAEADLLPAERRPTSGERLPDITLDCFGHPGKVSLRAVGGMPTVVNLWASWCEPCVREMPALESIHDAFDGKVRFLGVATKDYDKSARDRIGRTGVSYPSLWDPDEKLKNAIGTRSLPTTLLVGADGLVKDVHVGELTEAELRAKLREHLNVP